MRLGRHRVSRKLRPLRALCQDIVALRRGDPSGAWLQLEGERLEREREKSDEEVVAQFGQWAENQEVCDCICPSWVSKENRARRIREIFGRPPEPVAETAPAAAESNPVRPSQTGISHFGSEVAGGVLLPQRAIVVRCRLRYRHRRKRSGRPQP